jgi:Predicted nucleotidyltransferases
MAYRLPVDPQVLAAVCRRHRVRKLSLFGSRLKGTAGPDSDFDLLVEFEPDASPSLLDMCGSAALSGVHPSCSQ